MTEVSGLGWDDGRKMVVGPPEVWDDYVAVQKSPQAITDANFFRYHSFLLYGKLHFICYSIIATGKAAINAGQR